MKSQRPIRNQRRQYSCACAGSFETSTAKSLLLEPNGSNRFASPSRSSCSRMRPMPTRFALPHSEACSDTSIPVGSSPRNAAMTSHEPTGVSKTKKRPIADIGAGSKR